MNLYVTVGDFVIAVFIISSNYAKKIDKQEPGWNYESLTYK